MRPIERLLDRLPDARRSGKGYNARCPAHEDKKPSLSVGEGDDGRVLLTCHVGCTLDSICEALGLSTRDLFPATDTRSTPPRSGSTYGRVEDAIQAALEGIQRKDGPLWKVEKIHIYEDADGNEVARVVRFSDERDKTFRPFHRSNGVWKMARPKGKLPLYRAPSLRDADVVYVCEGEKAADAAEDLGLVSTTNAGGSNASGTTDWSLLRGKNAVLLPDNDEPGQKWTSAVARKLERVAASVKIVELPGLPDHGDIVEFIAARQAAGLDELAIRGEIERLVAGTPPCVSNGSAFQGGSPEFAARSEEPSREASVDFGELIPLPNALPPVTAFNLGLLPASLEPWIRDISERIQCPPDYAAVSAMAALGSVLGRKVGIRPKQRDDWLVVVNLYAVLIGRSGIMKTPALQEATRPLRRLEIAAKEEFEAATEDYNARCLVQDARKRAAQNEIKAALKEGEEKALEIARDVAASEPEGQTRKRYLANDSTVEKLGELLNENPNGILVLRDELIGLLMGLDKEGQECARAFYLEAWNGTSRFTYDRIGRGTIDIDSAILSVLGAIQPGPLGFYLAGAISGGRGDDGLLARFQLAVWPDIVPHWKNVDEWPNSIARDRAYGVFEHLDKLDPLEVGAEVDAQDQDGIPYLRFELRAQQVFDRWRGGLERRLRAGEEHPAIESHFAKYRSLIPSLALLIHLADGGVGPVTLEALRKAIGWGRYLASHVRRIYSIGISGELVAAKQLSKRIEKRDLEDGFTQRDVYRRGWAGLDRDGVSEGVEVLVDHGWLFLQRVMTGGAPKTVCRINPRILESPLNGPDTTDRSTNDPEWSSGSSADTPPNGADTTDKRQGQATCGSSVSGQKETSGETGNSSNGFDRKGTPAEGATAGVSDSSQGVSEEDQEWIL